MWDKALNKKGYGKRKYKGKDWKAHRAAWDEEIGPIPDGMFVLHKCDNPSCVNVNHLFLGTNYDNIKDMINKRRDNFFGAKKLNKDQVKEIRNSSKSREELCAIFGVCKGTISNVRQYHTYKD